MRDARGEWPYPTVDEASAAGEWTQIDEVNWAYFLDVLPPMYFPGGFFVGEPAKHDARGVPVHAAVVRTESGFYMREIAIDTASREKAVAELRAELAASACTDLACSGGCEDGAHETDAQAAESAERAGAILRGEDAGPFRCTDPACDLATCRAEREHETRKDERSERR